MLATVNGYIKICELCVEEAEQLNTLPPPLGTLNTALALCVCSKCHDALFQVLANRRNLRTIMGLFDAQER